MDGPVRWAILRLMSGNPLDDEEIVDAEIDLDDFQLWFQEHPRHVGSRQCAINLTGAQWDEIKSLPIVIARTEKKT